MPCRQCLTQNTFSVTEHRMQFTFWSQLMAVSSVVEEQNGLSLCPTSLFVLMLWCTTPGNQSGVLNTVSFQLQCNRTTIEDNHLIRVNPLRLRRGVMCRAKWIIHCKYVFFFPACRKAWDSLNYVLITQRLLRNVFLKLCCIWGKFELCSCHDWFKILCGLMRPQLAGHTSTCTSVFGVGLKLVSNRIFT